MGAIHMSEMDITSFDGLRVGFPMPKAFKIYPKHLAVTFLANLHADLGGRIQANRKEGERLTVSALAGESVYVQSRISSLRTRIE
jgi:hypothetical protein